jgi:hypothetical protein
MSHTPGPWAFVPGYSNGDVEGVEGCIQGGEAGLIIADVYCDVPELASEAPANLRLIAAAPDMLSVLKMIDREVTNGGECCPVCQQAPHFKHCALVDAIAQAEATA